MSRSSRRGVLARWGFSALVAGVTGALGLGLGATASATARLTPAGTVLVTNLVTNTVSAIDPGTGVVSRVGGAGLNGPLGIVIAPDARTAYVTNSLGDTISPIDLTTTPYRVGAPVTVGSGPSAIALAPDGTVAYVSNFNSNTVTPVYVTGMSVRAGAPIPVGAGPWSIAVSRDGRRVIVSNSEATTVSVIDVATRHVETLSVGGRPEAIAVAPTGDVAYVLSGADVVPVDLATTPVTRGAPIVVANKPVGIAVLPSGTVAYTVNADNTVTRLDLATNPVRVSSPVTVGSLIQADGVAISPNGRSVYIANASNTVTPVHFSATATVASSPIDVGAATFGVAVVPDEAPVTVFTARLGVAGRVTTFNASGSYAPNSAIAFYRWNFGDGATRTTTSPVVRYRYPAVGDYRVTLTAVTTDGTAGVRTFTGQSVINNGSSASRVVYVARVASPLEINPGVGAPGTAVVVRDPTLASTCRPLNIFFDGRLVAQSTPRGQVLSDPGVVVPGDARVGSHLISVSCSTPAHAVLSVHFDVVPLSNHLSEFSVAMPSPTTLKKHLAAAGFFGLLFLVFGRIFAAGFPSEWMDRTYASNFERVTRRMRRRFPWLFIDHEKERSLARRLSGGAGLLAVFIVAASLIDSFLSPGFGFNRTSLWLFLGQCLGIGLITVVSQGPIAMVGLREKKTVHLHVLVGGLAIAVVCVVASRSLGLAPGYCYGLIAVYVLRPTPSLAAEGRYHFISSIVVLAVSTVAFFLTVPVFHLATGAHPPLWAVLMDPALNMVFLAGFSGVAFGMFPLPFLPGHGVARWNRFAWAFLSVVALMGYVAVVLSPGSGTAQELHSVGIVPLLTTFVAFAVASLGFWAYHVRAAKAAGELHHGDHEDHEDQEDFEVFATE